MPSSSSRPRTKAARLDDAALAVSTAAQGIGGTRGGGHRAMEKLCCAVHGVMRREGAVRSCAAKQQRRRCCNARRREEDDS